LTIRAGISILKTHRKDVLKTVIAIGLLILACGSASALEFRQSSWMMSRAEVIASEQGRPVSVRDLPGQEEIVFQTSVAGIPVTITYILENDRLLSASYMFRRDPGRKAFEYMLRDLTSQKGSPAFSRADLVGWRLEKTEIALAHLADGASYAAFWEKDYFRRMNGTLEMGGPTRL
jgi:hypothetical protein